MGAYNECSIRTSIITPRPPLLSSFFFNIFNILPIVRADICVGPSTSKDIGATGCKLMQNGLKIATIRPSKGGERLRVNVLVTQSWGSRKARRPIPLDVRAPRPNDRRMASMKALTSAETEGCKEMPIRPIYWMESCSIRKHLCLVSQRDGTGVLLLAPRRNSWINLAAAHKGNETPTKVIMMEPKYKAPRLSSPLLNTGCFQHLGGKWWMYEFDLNTIANYLLGTSRSLALSWSHTLNFSASGVVRGGPERSNNVKARERPMGPSRHFPGCGCGTPVPRNASLASTATGHSKTKFIPALISLHILIVKPLIPTSLYP